MTTKEIRKKHGLTQKQFSKLTGVPLRTIESWDAGERTPPPYVLDMLDNYTEFCLKYKPDAME